MADQSMTDAERYRKITLLFSNNRPANNVPTGIDMMVGVIKAIPGNP